MARVLVIALCDPRREARVDRQVEALALEHDVTLASLEPPLISGVRFVRLAPIGTGALWRRIVNQALRMVGAHRRAYWVQACTRQWRSALGGQPFDLILANNVVTLPLAFDVAQGAPVVLDAHEHAPTENDAVWWWRMLIRPSVLWTCRTYLPRVRHMTTVSRGIAEMYRADYGVMAEVVTNAPRYQDLRPSPVHDPIRLFHFASGDPQRQIEAIIEVARILGDGYTLDLIVLGGPERYRAFIRERARRVAVTLRDPVAMRDLPAVANDYDIGIHLLPPLHDNQRLALPNKFFDFVQARLAVAIGPSPEMAEVAARWGFGIVADDFTPESLAKAIRAASPEDLATLKRHADEAARHLNARENGEVIRRVIRDTLPADEVTPG